MKRQLGIASLVAFTSGGSALQLNVSDENSIKDAARIIATGLYSYHNSKSTVGQFDQPYPWFWWLSGSGWNGLLDYTVYTNDTTFQSDLLSALSQNLGPNNNFVPPEQAGWEANDDQAYWVFNSLTAMEYKFPSLPCEASENGIAGQCANSWVAISTNAFENFITRWHADAGTCSGGLKWQYNPKNNGFYYKNTVSNGGFFQTAARLARYTGNQTFADWATRIWDWTTGVGFITTDYHAYDGAGDDEDANCTAIDRTEWSYNIASYLHGAAHMYAFANGSGIWESRVQGLVQAANATFFSPSPNATGIMYEQKCEQFSSCNTDQVSFKASLSRWLGKTGILVPSVAKTIKTLLEASAQGAATACDGELCGIKWYISGYDGQHSFGSQLSALEVIQSLLAPNAPKLAVSLR